MGFDDLEHLSELDEMPSFDEDLTLPGFDEGPGGGVSRTFVFLGFMMLLAVIVIVVLLVVFVLGGDDELSDFEKTSTAIAQANLVSIEDATATKAAEYAL
ncbi:MAG: hypothetical protein GYB65_14655, partial [Chloroflexi bacterium]|nr:hypothetical protein [Chloroflexota bacterium]